MSNDYLEFKEHLEHAFTQADRAKEYKKQSQESVRRQYEDVNGTVQRLKDAAVKDIMFYIKDYNNIIERDRQKIVKAKDMLNSPAGTQAKSSYVKTNSGQPSIREEIKVLEYSMNKNIEKKEELEKELQEIKSDKTGKKAKAYVDGHKNDLHHSSISHAFTQRDKAEYYKKKYTKPAAKSSGAVKPMTSYISTYNAAKYDSGARKALEEKKAEAGKTLTGAYSAFPKLKQAMDEARNSGKLMYRAYLLFIQNKLGGAQGAGGRPQHGIQDPKHFINAYDTYMNKVLALNNTLTRISQQKGAEQYIQDLSRKLSGGAKGEAALTELLLGIDDKKLNQIVQAYARAKTMYHIPNHSSHVQNPSTTGTSVHRRDVKHDDLEHGWFTDLFKKKPTYTATGSTAGMPSNIPVGRDTSSAAASSFTDQLAKLTNNLYQYELEERKSKEAYERYRKLVNDTKKEISRVEKLRNNAVANSLTAVQKPIHTDKPAKYQHLPQGSKAGMPTNIPRKK